MDLTEQQVQAICKWAESEPLVIEVRLFGSRMQRGGNPNRDVDLAVTVDGGRACTPDGNYQRFGDQWQDDLTRLLGLPADVNLYARSVKSDCDESSILLWPVP